MVTRTEHGIHFACGRWPLDPQKSTILFIHGSGGTHRLWQAQVEGVVERVNTLALDLPGHGGSAGGGRTEVSDYAADVVGFLDALAVPKPIPCGLSLGGAICQQLLLDHPERFRAGVLVGTGARLRVLPAILDSIRNDYAGFIAASEGYAFSARTPAEIKRRYLEEAASCPAEVTFGDFSACDRFDVMARIGAIAVPVLVVSAADDRLTPPKYADYLERNIPRAVRAHIADAGHMAPLEKPAEFNAAVRGFLDACAL